MPPGQEFAGLAGSENRDTFDVHAVDDNRANEGEALVKLVAPRQKSSAPTHTATASTFKKPGTDWSASAAGKAIKTHTKKSGKAVPPIKFGPPRVRQNQDDAAEPSDRGTGLASASSCGNAVAAGIPQAGSITVDERSGGGAVVDRGHEDGFTANEDAEGNSAVVNERTTSSVRPQPLLL